MKTKIDDEIKNLSDFVLQKLCKNARIDGIRFGPVLQILLANDGSQEFPIEGQIYLNLSSIWTLFESRPITFPMSEKDLPIMTVEEEIKTICSIREQVITRVELGEDEPHLILTLDDERIIFVNGKNDQYESWSLGTASGGIEQSWQVIACPGGGVAICTPPNFSFEKFSLQMSRKNKDL